MLTLERQANSVYTSLLLETGCLIIIMPVYGYNYDARKFEIGAY